jgi:molybdopterin synthase sulfur carrier subunit
MPDAGSKTEDATRTGTVTVVLPPALRRLFPGAPATAAVEAATVRDMLAALDTRWPGMKDRLCDTRPAIRRHINIFVEGERARLDTALPAGGTVFVLTAMSGG